MDLAYGAESAPSLGEVPAEPPSPDELRTAFLGLLNQALTRGRAARTNCGLGPGTLAAIDMVAYDHPDAEADCIAAAYDAFYREHGEGRAAVEQERLSRAELGLLDLGN